MYTECFRIFVFEKELIEDALKKYSKDKLIVESFFFNLGAYICAFSEEKNLLNRFFLELEKTFGFFVIRNSDFSDFSLPAEDIAGSVLEKSGKTSVTSESCTGGLVAKKLTDRSGSSAYFWGSFVTYDNNAKINLGVKEETLEKYGAVSVQTVTEMAESARLKSGADIAVSVSGVAGPGGGSAEKPVGTVWFGYSDCEKDVQLKFLFKGSRKDVREKASETALLIIIRSILYEAGVDSIISGDYI